MHILVRDNNVDQALRVLKKKMQCEGVFREMKLGSVAELVGIEGGVVSGVINLESLGVGAPSRRPRHENRYHDA